MRPGLKCELRLFFMIRRLSAYVRIFFVLLLIIVKEVFMFRKNWFLNESIRKFAYYLFLILAVLIAFKIACYFMPFLIALIIANSIEPLIKKISQKTGLVRKKSAVIALVLVFGILIGIIVGFSVLAVSEISDLLKNFGGLGNEVFKQIGQISNMLRLENVDVSNDVKVLVVDATDGLVSHALDYFRNFLIGALNLITQIPAFVIYLVITILATYFICTSRIALLDELEQKVPKRWVRKISRYFNTTLSALGKYVKAELILIFISFVLVLIGLYVFKFLGMDIKSPFLIALGIGFVDLLPILGSGTVMAPWGIIEIITGNTVLGVAILGLLIFISLVRQFLEPKVVSTNLGVNPLYTLIAMYVGFKVYGVIGLIVGPIVLVVLMSVMGQEKD